MMEEGCPGEEQYIRNLEKVYDLYEQTVFYPLPEKVKEQIHSQVNPEPDIRSGWDQNHINAVEDAKIIEKAGASAICVHPRTRNQGYSGKSDWNIIKEVKDNSYFKG